MNFKQRRLIWAIIFSIFLFSACKSLKNTNTLFQSEYDKFADTAKAVYVANEPVPVRDKSYKIKPYDHITVRNLQNPEGLGSSSGAETSQSLAVFRVDKAGFVNLPVVGNVELNNLNQHEAASKLQALYGKTMLKNPIIELTIVNYRVTLLGETAKPGNYILDRENETLIELLGKSGGLLPSSDARKIKIIRGDRKNPEVIFVNLKDLNSLKSDKIILENNDIVYITPLNLFNVSEGLKSYSAILQPVFILMNAVLLIYTIGKQ